MGTLFGWRESRKVNPPCRLNSEWHWSVSIRVITVIGSKLLLIFNACPIKMSLVSIIPHS